MLSPGIRKLFYNTLGTIVINSPISPPSLAVKPKTQNLSILFEVYLYCNEIQWQAEIRMINRREKNIKTMEVKNFCYRCHITSPDIKIVILGIWFDTSELTLHTIITHTHTHKHLHTHKHTLTHTYTQTLTHILALQYMGVHY